jgi:hypothetical protein
VGVVQEYREDLLELPRNGWSLLGLGQALTALGSPDGQALISKDFRAAWADADVPIDSSCLSFSKFWTEAVQTGVMFEIMCQQPMLAGTAEIAILEHLQKSS